MNSAGVLAFDYPWAFWAFAIFIPIFLHDLFSTRKKRIRKTLQKKLKTKLNMSAFFFRLFLALVILGLAGPRWGMGQAERENRRRLSAKTADVVIAIDVSRSMELPDGANTGGTSRLQRGMAIVTEACGAFQSGTQDMRFAAAVSRGRGILAIPLTWDNSAVLAFMQSLDSSAITGRGTDLESLVDTAAGAFQKSSPSIREIILVSDGEALSGSVKAALERCSRDGIAVTAVAVGSDEGLPVHTDGQTISRRDMAAMRMAAGQTGGICIDGNRSDAAGLLSSRLRSLAFEQAGAAAKNEHKPRWLIFALLAIMALGASKLSLLQMRKERP